MSDDKPTKRVTTIVEIYGEGAEGLSEQGAIVDADPGWPANPTLGWLLGMPLRYVSILASLLLAAFVAGFTVGQIPLVQKIVAQYGSSDAGSGAEGN